MQRLLLYSGLVMLLGGWPLVAGCSRPGSRCDLNRPEAFNRDISVQTIEQRVHLGLVELIELPEGMEFQVKRNLMGSQLTLRQHGREYNVVCGPIWRRFSDHDINTAAELRLTEPSAFDIRSFRARYPTDKAIIEAIAAMEERLGSEAVFLSKERMNEFVLCRVWELHVSEHRPMLYQRAQFRAYVTRLTDGLVEAWVFPSGATSGFWLTAGTPTPEKPVKAAKQRTIASDADLLMWVLRNIYIVGMGET